MNEIKNIIATTFTKGTATIITTRKSADKSMNKGRGTNRNPYIGRVEVITTYSGYVMGTDYSNSVKNIAERLGGVDVVVNTKSSWHVPCAVLPEWFATDKKTMTKTYLKIQRSEQMIAHKVTTAYIVDGRSATDSEVAEIKSWLTAKSSGSLSSTQRAVGIDDEHKQEFKLLDLETIVSIKQGAREIKPKELLKVKQAS